MILLVALAAASVAFPPIPEGFYAYDSSCRAAVAGVDKENPPTNLVLFTRNTFMDPLPEGGPEITGFQNVGGKRWKILTRTGGNGDGPSESGSFFIKIVGPDLFETEDYITSYQYCPNVPAWIRKQWYE